MYCSELFLNYNCSEVEEFRARLLDGKHELEGGITNLPASSLSSGFDDIYSISMKKTLDEVLDTKEASVCVVVATVHSIETEYNWYYNGLQKQGQSLATRAHARGDVMWHLCFQDTSFNFMSWEFASASFILFDGPAYEVIGKTASKLREKVIQEGDPDSFPEELDIVVGRKFVFKIEIKAKGSNERGQTYKVFKISSDKSIIQSLIDSVEENEESIADVVNLESQSKKTPTSKKGKEVVNLGNDDELEQNDDEMSCNNVIIKKIKLEKEA